MRKPLAHNVNIPRELEGSWPNASPQQGRRYARGAIVIVAPQTTKWSGG